MLKGSDRVEVRARWEGPGRCICKTGTIPCHTDLPLDKLYNFCVAWHSLSPDEEWFLMVTQYTGATGAPEQKDGRGCLKLTWYLQGVPLCFTDLCHLIATGPMTIRRLLKEGDAVPSARVWARCARWWAARGAVAVCGLLVHGALQ